MNSAADLPTVEAIVIGASAGGVEALLSILSPLREGFVLPIIVVLHLPDERRSHLAEVFARRVAMRVVEAHDKTLIETGTLYFATPGYHLSVEQDRTFSLSLEDRVHYSRPAIDFLFSSAADAYGPALAAVLLTGANRDGASGMAKVQHLGGLTIVQDPNEAQVATMPLAALDVHQPDHILPIRGIGRLLVELERIAC
ncbi:Chemotaxis response regulator protein-glutamate methylesterase [Pseudomonas fluorescens]|jgi:two-component system chemotaxis response regulator CheB|uniref:protein-glutamate methylesterase n=1 Tax=Pseudomonas fluorescens TaxID=294 RepID=A0A5E7I770_PSEFL|nr:chemotaxis protein CheB [Pseudomonas fluorescens]VVO09399.1 Chemotaxis response regulator protein-glutamate methylesterase [Pseudomonas fluorescens]VVO70387.1 Chemotaxis response regulator protein-glutamate methylesterase [Pseudomonas fluorescens]